MPDDSQQLPDEDHGQGQDAELLSDFLIEAGEHLLSIETHLLQLDQGAGGAEALQAVFRGFHTIKGLAGFLNFPVLQEVAHESESLLDLARSGTSPLSAGAVDVLLESVDYVRNSLAGIKANLEGRRSAGEPPARQIIRSLRAASADLAPASPPADPAVQESGNLSQPEIAGGETPGRRDGDTVVRVSTAKLDYLVDMVGEMVIAQSLLRHDPEITRTADSQLLRNLSHLNRITTEIQKTVMSMRMIPVRHLFQRTARLLRDAARKAGKEIELAVSGEETELDRNIIEELSAPLMHMVRNAIDHGIESAEERAAAGKPTVGQIALNAYHQASHIVIEVSDDGRGIDRRKVITKALEKGLIESGAAMTDAEVFQLIFRPGFTTAGKVTDISGRGVGMDVVRKHIEKLRGRITTDSKPGMGATFRLKLPLTLAIIEGLVVAVGQERYIVPIFAVREVLRPRPDMISTVQAKGEMARIRDSLVPVVRLHRRFRVEPKSESAQDGILIVSENAGNRFCLLVDRLLGKQEVVIKGLGAMLKSIAGVSGSAILGDGHVGLILDMDGFVHDPA
ncbi:MAG TPA: chemotaxis protein CheA [Bryobacteraceae bacterium]|nr:chemotaxis protein CheA [Bryobacteraceae bacterium]